MSRRRKLVLALLILSGAVVVERAVTWSTDPFAHRSGSWNEPSVENAAAKFSHRLDAGAEAEEGRALEDRGRILPPAASRHDSADAGREAAWMVRGREFQVRVVRSQSIAGAEPRPDEWVAALDEAIRRYAARHPGQLLLDLDARTTIGAPLVIHAGDELDVPMR